MKKLNKYQKNTAKLLLATMTIPVIVSALPTIEDVHANEVPTLNAYMQNGVPKIEWSVPMLEKNILNKTSFETGDELPTINYGGKTGQQSFSKETAVTGATSLKIGKTTPNLGNAIFYPAVTSERAYATFSTRKYIENGKYLSVNMKVKTDSTANFSPQGQGGFSDRQATMQEILKTTESFKFTKDTKVGDNFFYVTNPQALKDAIGSSVRYVVSKKSTTGNYAYLEIKSIDVTTGKVTLAKSFEESFKTGENVLGHRNTNPVNFQSRTVENTNGKWETLSFNAYVNGGQDYNTLVRGFNFVLYTVSEGNSYIDDIEFGYATEVEVFRDNTSIYKGFLSDYQDKNVKDTTNPNAITTINSIIDDNNVVKFTPVKPADTVQNVNYKVQSIAADGTRSTMSTPKTVNIATGVQTYNYAITKDATAPTTLNQTGTTLSVPINKLSLDNYIHVQSVDGNGNVSTTQSFQLKNIVDISELQYIYDRLNEVKESNNYDDFLAFLDEVESLYGNNIPQDIAKQIQYLAKVHDVNTAFLLLLEGDFSLQTADITSFGKTKLTAEKQVLYTSFVAPFTVIDARGTQQGWKVNVSATPFVEDTFDGFVGEPVQLPIGTLALNTLNNIEQVGTVHNSQLPLNILKEATIIDSGTVTIANADVDKGMGEFKLTYGEKALSMVVDSTTAKIDKVNYPEGVTPYTSTVTFDLITGP